MATGRVPTTANSPLTAKGDLFGYSTTQARVPVGNNGETIVADSSTSTGLRYQATNAAGKNVIINGAFEVWQRGTSFTANGFTADRWAVSTPGSNTWSRSTTAPSGFNYSINWVTSGSYPTLYNYVELPVTGAKGNFVGTWTLSFYAKASTATTMGAGGNWVDGSSRANAVTIIDSSVSLTTSWQRFTIPINFDGSSPVGTSKAVEMGFYIASGGATVNITGVQLEIGSVPTAFTRAGGTFQGELAACQRYYEKSFPMATAPANGGTFNFETNMTAYSTADIRTAWLPFKVNKRTSSPTITYFRNADIATNGQWAYYIGGWATPTATTTASSNDNGFLTNIQKATTFTLGSSYIIGGEWTAEAEL